jgi:hypothetical protein
MDSTRTEPMGVPRAAALKNPAMESSSSFAQQVNCSVVENSSSNWFHAWTARFAVGFGKPAWIVGVSTINCVLFGGTAAVCTAWKSLVSSSGRGT